MRFKHAKDGDVTEWKRKFAWLPVQIKDIDGRYYTVWLEYYQMRKVYQYKIRATRFGWDSERRMITDGASLSS